MTRFDLLDTVLPSDGRYCVLGLGKYAAQTFWDSKEEVDAEVEKLVGTGFNVYFGCAKYGEMRNREHKNAKFFKALWMDIDCGADKAAPDDKGVIKGYIDQETGLKAVQVFCKSVNMPRPIVVDSGRGLHFYWILATTISRNEWEPLSKRLRDLCLEQKLIIDPSVFEASRVLRVPGTYNFKDGGKLEVSVVSSVHAVTDYAAMQHILGAPDPVVEEDTSFLPKTSPLMEAMLSNRIKRFKTIMIKSAEGVGCNQILHCYTNQADIDYNLWRSALSIATNCVDRDTAIHKMSNQYPGYSHQETEAKAADIGGPHHCETFEAQNKGGCTDCPNKGKFKSPIMLGLEIAQEEGGDEDGESSAVALPGKTGKAMYFLPYFRGKNGGVYRMPDDAEEEPQLVYEHDIYVVKRMDDPVEKEIALIRLHLPQDGVAEFTIPLVNIMVKEDLRKSLAQYGVIAFPKQMELLYYYIGTSIKNMQITDKREIMRTQFGWADSDSKIIIGDREITAQGIFYSPPSSTTRSIADSLVPVGTLEKWKEVFNLYARPGLESNAFAALTGFGSLLLKFTGMSGAIINVMHSSSGSGKSTALYMCNSIYGDPVKLGSIWKDTVNVKMHRLGVMNNLPNTIDEITNTTPMEFSDLAYSISQGRGKHRMKSSANEERTNLTSWQGITLASANASFYEKLGSAKDSPDGESMRLLEYKIEPSTIIPMEVGKQMFDHQLRENYGHAGDIYAEWLVGHLEEAVDLVRKVQAKLDKEIQFTSRERFWSAVCACNIAGGLISKQLDLHNYDMKAIYDWLTKMLGSMREEIKPPSPNLLNVVGDFLNNHMHNALVVNGELDARSNLSYAPILVPKGELLVRYEPDRKRMYISAGAFREYCVERQVNYKSTLKDLEGKKIFLGALNKRLSKGMHMVSPAIRALEFDTSSEDFLSVDDYYKPAVDADRDSTLHN